MKKIEQKWAGQSLISFFHTMREHKKYSGHLLFAVILAGLLLSAGNAAAAGVDLSQHAPGTWTIAGKAGKNTWIVIHNLKEAKNTGVYHIEVLSRGVTDPSWRIEHVVDHMAITEEALAASVVRPITIKAVYPETYDNGYKIWQRKNGGKGGAVCTTTVSDCIVNKK